MARKPADPGVPEPSGKAPIRPWFLDRGDHRCRPGVARCDDRYRDHHCDRGAAPRHRRAAAARAPAVGPAAGRRRGRDGGAPAAGPAGRPGRLRRPGDDRDRRGRLRAALADHAGRRRRARSPAPRPSPALVPERPSRRQLLGLALLGLVAVGRGRPGWPASAARDVVLPLILVAAGLAVIWRQLDSRPHPRRPGHARWALAGGVVLGAGGVVLLLATTGQLANARNGFAATLVILVGVVLATAPLWRRLLDSRGRGAGGADPLGGARRRRRAPARLGAADPGADPAARRRPAGGQPAGPQPGARAARLAVRPDGRPRGRHLGRAGRAAWSPRSRPTTR